MLTEKICQRNSNHSPYIFSCIFERFTFSQVLSDRLVLTVPLQVKDQLRQIQGCTCLNMRFRTVKVRITFYNIFLKKTPKKGCFFDCTELVEGDGEGEQLPGCRFDFHSAVVLAGVVTPLHHLLVISQLLLFIPPSPKTPYFSIQ